MLCHQEGERTGVDVAHTGTHHQSFGWGEAHGGVHALPVFDSGHGGAVADVAGDHFCILGVYAEEAAHTLAHIAVAGAVESVAAHTVLGVVAVGYGVHERLGGHRLVEGGVEHAHLGHAGHDGLDGFDAYHVGGVVEGGDVVALTDFLFHGIVDEHAGAELLAAVYHAVAYGVDFVVGGYAAHLAVGKVCKDGLDGLAVVDEAQSDCFLAAVGLLVFEEAAGKPYFFHSAFGENVGAFAVGVEEFILHRTAAAVEHENFHIRDF